MDLYLFGWRKNNYFITYIEIEKALTRGEYDPSDFFLW